VNKFGLLNNEIRVFFYCLCDLINFLLSDFAVGLFVLVECSTVFASWFCC